MNIDFNTFIVRITSGDGLVIYHQPCGQKIEPMLDDDATIAMITEVADTHILCEKG